MVNKLKLNKLLNLKNKILEHNEFFMCNLKISELYDISCQVLKLFNIIF